MASNCFDAEKNARGKTLGIIPLEVKPQQQELGPVTRACPSLVRSPIGTPSLDPWLLSVAHWSIGRAGFEPQRHRVKIPLTAIRVISPGMQNGLHIRTRSFSIYFINVTRLICHKRASSAYLIPVEGVGLATGSMGKRSQWGCMSLSIKLVVLQ